MEKNVIFYILGMLMVIYIVIGINNKRKSKSRQNRKFMGDYKRKNDKK